MKTCVHGVVGVALKYICPPKPIKYGLKLFALCESKTGYACSLSLHSNKIKDGNLEMIRKLSKSYEGLNHHIYMDNFYTSTKTFEALKENGFYCCGTLRENRGGPKGLKPQIKKLNKGEGVIMNNQKITYIGFKDNGIVQMISNIHSENTISTPDSIMNGFETPVRDIKNKRVVIDYNNFMGGVDLMDQMTKYYGIHKKTKKWTTKLALHILNISFHNTYVLFKKSRSDKTNYLDYLIAVMNALSSHNTTNVSETRGAALSSAARRRVNNRASYNISEPLSHYAIRSSKRHRCVNCLDSNIRKDTSNSCANCKVFLCAKSCFKEWHDKQYHDQLN